MGMDWFERITGFREADYERTRRRLKVDGEHLVSDANEARWAIGSFETPTLDDLRARAATAVRRGPRSRVQCVVGDARGLHSEAALAGATFQVASQFNALEMVSPNVTPEDGVSCYAFDPTQGPACAMAAGAATIWRNYFMPLPGGPGQTARRQLNTLAGTGELLSRLLACPVESLWTMRNGYALATATGLSSINGLLRSGSDASTQQLRGSLAIAWQRHADVTDARAPAAQRVSQVFCSALPVAYTRLEPSRWEPFARLVLEATYEATLLAACLQGASGGSDVVLLTRVGGGAFGNADRWIDDAIRRALAITEFAGLDIRLVSRDQVHPSFHAIASEWAQDDARR